MKLKRTVEQNATAQDRMDHTIINITNDIDSITESSQNYQLNDNQLNDTGV
jgi:hypothetical protein